MYVVCLTVTRTIDSWTHSVSVTTFYLNEDVQGFSNEEGALRVAEDVVNPFRDPTIKVHGYAGRI